MADEEVAVYAEDPRIMCRLYEGYTRVLLGYPETGLRVAREGLGRAHSCNNPHTIAWSLVVLANMHTYLRDAAGAERAGAEAIDIARHHRFPQWLAMAQQWRGWGLCQLGDVDHGLALLEEGLRRQHAIGQMGGTSKAYCQLAEGCLLARRPASALDNVKAAYRHAETYGERYMSAEIHRLYAEVLHIRGAPALESERHLRAALDIARYQAAHLWELRAATSLARLWHSQGRATEAHGLLAPIHASFTEGFDLPDLIDARALLSGASSIQRSTHD